MYDYITDARLSECIFALGLRMNPPKICNEIPSRAEGECIRLASVQSTETAALGVLTREVSQQSGAPGLHGRRSIPQSHLLHQFAHPRSGTNPLRQSCQDTSLFDAQTPLRIGMEAIREFRAAKRSQILLLHH